MTIKRNLALTFGLVMLTGMLAPSAAVAQLRYLLPTLDLSDPDNLLTCTLRARNQPKFDLGAQRIPANTEVVLVGFVQDSTNFAQVMAIRAQGSGFDRVIRLKDTNGKELSVPFQNAAAFTLSMPKGPSWYLTTRQETSCQEFVSFGQGSHTPFITVLGSTGKDLVFLTEEVVGMVCGNAGDDQIEVERGVAYGGEGDDALFGSGVLRGGDGSDYLDGGSVCDAGPRGDDYYKQDCSSSCLSRTNCD